MSYQDLIKHMQQCELQQWAELIPQQLASGLDTNRFGDLSRWQAALEDLPIITADVIDFNSPAITVSRLTPLPEEQRQQLDDVLRRFMPWRKGPFDIHGVSIDTEWRSDLKWARLIPHIQPLKDRVVLDVGCGSGYHGWRMLGESASLVIGIDPSPLFVMQYQVIKHFTGEQPFYVLPVGIDDVPEKLRAFDTVFSMGVLYHRRSPIDHLMQLRDCLKPGGELVLDTLVIEGDVNQVLLPRQRYAKMRNVWFIPSCDAICLWLERCGFKDIKLIDVSVTSIEEQRSTDWMRYESLSDFLDPEDSSLTIESYPAPMRAVFTATAP
ncbi:MAG: tRNA 5-methoxyuridine(34)/uridine 5-oxyacetic acid(34) synthase CmoB [Gammaproteobacteria bacterium]|nr:tRNA 5-methoxyuridine(34)/uridine 5-oxyacetic acid(34) synthase CmoB [Gammaproteobacteria bacterium]